jgi:hypothetical protein
MLILFLLLAFSDVNAVFKTDKYYSQDVTCSNYFTSWFVSQVTTCTPVATCENLNGVVGRITTCTATAPTFPDGWVTFTSYQTLDCSDAGVIMSAPLATCTGYWVGSPVSLNCVGSACRLTNCAQALQSCAGCPSQDTNGINTCVQGNPTSGYTMLAFNIAPPPFTTARPTTTGATTTTAVVINGTTATPTTNPACGTLLSISMLVIVLIFCV